MAIQSYSYNELLQSVQGKGQAKQNKYDGILMDIRMPVMNGLEAAEKIREFLMAKISHKKNSGL